MIDQLYDRSNKYRNEERREKKEMEVGEQRRDKIGGGQGEQEMRRAEKNRE